MNKLLRYLKGYRVQALLAPLFKLFEAALELLVPLCVASLIDRGLGGGDRGYIFKMVLYMVALALLGLTASVTAQYFSAKTASGFARSMKSDLFAHILTLSASDRDRLGTSTMITRLTSDANQVQSCVNMFLRLFLRSPFVVLGAAIMAFIVEPKLGWIFAVVIPLLSIVVYFIMKKTIPMHKRVQADVDRVVLATRENLAGARVIRAFSKEDEERSEFKESTELLYSDQMRAGGVSALLNPMTAVLVNLAIVVLLYYGNALFELSLIELGSIVALVNYMNQILVELIKFANLIVTVTRGIASGNRIQGIFELKSALESNGGEIGDLNAEDAVVFDNVSLTYAEGGSPSLKNISFVAKRGERIGVIGGTGSGKSSLVNLIPRFYDATEGSVRVFGRDVKSENIDFLRGNIAVVPQKARLFKGTIRENLLWGNENATDEELIEALRLAQAYEFVSKKDGGLDYGLEQRGRNLSGGQRQRLTIARALCRGAKILILDDSASALDYATDARLRESLNSLRDTTVFIVSQRTSSLLSCDRVIVLEDGEMKGWGSPEELLRDNALYREIHFSQVGGENNG